MNTRFKIIPLIISIAIPILVGLLSSWMTSSAMTDFNQMEKPPLSPPAWLFPLVWTILYILMGVACYLIFRSDSNLRSIAIILYSAQLFMNFFWSLLFFNNEMYWFALVWLLVMWLILITLLILTCKFSIPAMLCLLPLTLWTTFAAYLNLMIARLN